MAIAVLLVPFGGCWLLLETLSHRLSLLLYSR
jgi:hypothetical protein